MKVNLWCQYLNMPVLTDKQVMELINELNRCQQSLTWRRVWLIGPSVRTSEAWLSEEMNIFFQASNCYLETAALTVTFFNHLALQNVCLYNYFIKGPTHIDHTAQLWFVYNWVWPPWAMNSLYKHTVNSYPIFQSNMSRNSLHWKINLYNVVQIPPY